MGCIDANLFASCCASNIERYIALALLATSYQLLDPLSASLNVGSPFKLQNCLLGNSTHESGRSVGAPISINSIGASPGISNLTCQQRRHGCEEQTLAGNCVQLLM